METKDKYFGLNQGDGEVVEQKPGFHKGMLLKKKAPDNEDNFDTDQSSEPQIPRDVC